MIKIEENKQLKKFNTFAIEANAKYFAEIHSLSDLQNLQKNPIVSENDFLILGDGSNILFANDFEGIVIHIANKGIQTIQSDNEFSYVEAAAGENWDHFVSWCINSNLSGLENLSLIPGTVGASPVQNIGAYGAEVKNTIWQVHTMDIITGNVYTYDNKDCKFDYRSSIFKNKEYKNQIITSVVFKLRHKNHQYILNYRELKEKLSHIEKPTAEALRDIVIHIREEKLPNPEKIPNAGSFFKNPIVDGSMHQKLISEFPSMVSYTITNTTFKIAAGWLIEHSGWKGHKNKTVGVHENQALVLINHNNGTGKDIVELAKEIQDSVKKKYGVDLQMEVNLI